VDASPERQIETAPDNPITPAQRAHIQHRVKTGKVRLQTLDKVAPSVDHKVWKVDPRSKDSAINDHLPHHDEHCLAIKPSHASVSTPAHNPGTTRVSARDRSSTAGSDGNTNESVLDGHDEPDVYEGVDSCVICHDSLVDDARVRELQCCHVFHADCIERWLITCRGSCPVCNAPVELCAVPG
jgi:hypothetical protein